MKGGEEQRQGSRTRLENGAAGVAVSSGLLGAECLGWPAGSAVYQQGRMLNPLDLGFFILKWDE